MRIGLALAAALTLPGFAMAAEPDGEQTVQGSPDHAATASDNSSGDSPWYSRLPFLAEEARKRGHELPLPFGAALVLTGLDGRKIEVTDTRIALEDNPGQSISNFVDLGSTSQVFNANLKFDTWVLPFLNLYALVGYVHNNSTTHAHVTVLPGAEGHETDIDTELDGIVGGVGVTLAGGYKQFFAVADYNYNKADLGFDENFTAKIASLRGGWMGKVGSKPVQLWLGVGDWDTAATAKGHGTLDNGMRFSFEADQRPKTNWMYDIGSQIEFSKSFQLVIDVGTDFDGGYLFVLAPTYRFPASAGRR
jgi:hypothetical protein